MTRGSWRLTATEEVSYSPAGDAGAFFADKEAAIIAAITARSAAVEASVGDWNDRWMMALQPIVGREGKFEQVTVQVGLWTIDLAIAPSRAMDRFRREDLAARIAACFDRFP